MYHKFRVQRSGDTDDCTVIRDAESISVTVGQCTKLSVITHVNLTYSVTRVSGDDALALLDKQPAAKQKTNYDWQCINVFYD